MFISLLVLPVSSFHEHSCFSNEIWKSKWWWMEMETKACAPFTWQSESTLFISELRITTKYLFYLQAGGPGPSRAELRRLSQLSKGGGYGMVGGYNPRYLTRGGTSRHPHTYSLQWDSHKCLHLLLSSLSLSLCLPFSLLFSSLAHIFTFLFSLFPFVTLSFYFSCHFYLIRVEMTEHDYKTWSYTLSTMRGPTLIRDTNSLEKYADF